MTIYNLTDFSRFFHFVLGCKGNVWYIDKHGAPRDLKELAAYTLNTGIADRVSSIDRLEVQAECGEDSNRLLRYMISAGRTADFTPIAQAKSIAAI
jgi:hypothetical protein